MPGSQQPQNRLVSDQPTDGGCFSGSDQHADPDARLKLPFCPCISGCFLTIKKLGIEVGTSSFQERSVIAEIAENLYFHTFLV